MRTIKIDNECDSSILWSDEWKGYVYAPEEEFDEVFVIKGNRDYNQHTSASWYQKALEYLEENDIYESNTNIMNALEKLFPNDTFKWSIIRGSCQGEWQDVIYKANAMEDDSGLIDDLQDFYFGYVSEIYDEEENCVYCVSHTDMWKHEDNLDNYIRNLCCIDDNEEIEILKSDGYSMVKNWVAV